MSDALAHYSFLPWFRQGIASKIDEADTYAAPGADGTNDERARLQVELSVESEAVADAARSDNLVRKEVSIYGPGDVKGFSPRVVVRTEPKAGIDNYEANNLAYLEFYEEDFPWRYTPVSPDAGSLRTSRRLRPWITLVVLEADEFILHPSTEGISSITVTQAVIDGTFPPVEEVWAWAHVQINRHLEHVSGAALVSDVTTELDADPDMGISRLICPRKLRRSTAYSAFVVPSFEVGRVGGLDQDTAGVKAQRPAWRQTAPGSQPAAEDTQFPFYFHWQFQTGEHGDFESLVSLLDPIVMQPESGKIPMDIQTPGFGLDDLSAEPILGFEGALKPPGFEADPFASVAGNQDFLDRLRKVLNLSADAAADPAGPDNTVADVAHPFYSAVEHAVDDPILVPPIYGMWHALIHKLAPTPAASKPWVHELNLDPRHRGAAGLGTQTVQQEQERLMDEAWHQVGEINRINDRMRQAELAKKASARLFRKHFGRESNDHFLQRTALMHDRVSTGGTAETVNEAFRTSRIPLAAKSAAFKRIVRPTRRVNRKLGQQSPSAEGLHREVLVNFNRDEAAASAITAAKLKIAPVSVVSLGGAAAAITAGQAAYQADPVYAAKDAFLSFFDARHSDTLADRAAWIAAVNAETNLTLDVRGRLVDLINALTEVAAQAEAGISLTLANASYEAYFGTSSSGKRYRGVLVMKESEPDIDRVGTATTQDDIVRFQEQFAALQAVTSNSSDVEFLPPTRLPMLANLDGISNALRSKLHPEVTITERVLKPIKVWDGTSMQPLTDFKPIMAHPAFDDPVYAFLKQLSQDFILPNVEQLAADSITLVQTNQRFIEAYMVGLNHEMARELLWREFPTDQRGSYFRQFWDVKDNLLEDDPEAQLDIDKLHTWARELGDHRARQWNEDDPEDDGNIVLVVRGQLLRKYPNTMVYAQKALYDPADPTAQRVMAEDSPATVKYPLFSAELEPDIFLFGFDLSIDQARGHRLRGDQTVGGSHDPGWFFAFKERPGQTKFGLDDFADEFGDTSIMPPTANPATWDDLTWEHLVDVRESLERYVLRFDRTLAPTDPAAGELQPEWGHNAADVASILYQSPVLFARHAGEMLPEEDSS